MKLRLLRWMGVTLLCAMTAMSSVALASSGVNGQDVLARATKLVVEIEDAQGKLTQRIEKSVDPTLLNCLSTETTQLVQYSTDAKGIESRVKAFIETENNDAVSLEEQKLDALEPNVKASILRAGSCVGAEELGDGMTMSVTVTGGDKSDSGDDGFGASDAGTTRTEEASAR